MLDSDTKQVAKHNLCDTHTLIYINQGSLILFLNNLKKLRKIRQYISLIRVTLMTTPQTLMMSNSFRVVNSSQILKDKSCHNSPHDTTRPKRITCKSPIRQLAERLLFPACGRRPWSGDYKTPCVRLSRFCINLNISFIYKDIFTKFAGNVYANENLCKFFFLLFPIFVIIIYTIQNVVHSIRQSYNSRLKENLKSNNRTNQHEIQNLHTICYMLHKLKRHFNIYI